MQVTKAVLKMKRGPYGQIGTGEIELENSIRLSNIILARNNDGEYSIHNANKRHWDAFNQIIRMKIRDALVAQMVDQEVPVVSRYMGMIPQHQ